MIKFFRKIRYDLIEKNKTGKYLKYALGEIVLVVIGILIALQINNWNENRKMLINEKITLNKFLQDLKLDSTYFQINLKRIEVINDLHLDLYNIGFKDDQEIELKEPNYIRRHLIYHPTAKENNLAIISKINNERIIENIQKYFRDMDDTQEAIDEHEIVVFEIRAFLRQRKIHNTSGWFESNMNLENPENPSTPQIITGEKLKQLSKDGDFQQLLFESSVKLSEMKHQLNSLTEKNSELIDNIKKYLND